MRNDLPIIGLVIMTWGQFTDIDLSVYVPKQLAEDGGGKLLRVGLHVGREGRVGAEADSRFQLDWLEDNICGWLGSLVGRRWQLAPVCNLFFNVFFFSFLPVPLLSCRGGALINFISISISALFIDDGSSVGFGLSVACEFVILITADQWMMKLIKVP